MHKYWYIFQLSFQEVLTYRFDLLAHMFKYAFMLVMMSFVWLAVGEATNFSRVSLSDTVSYFFLAAVIYSLSNFHTNYIEEDIRYGYLTKYLLKPISPFGNYLTYELARAIIETILKTLTFTPLMILMGLSFSIAGLNLLIFMCFLPLIFFFSFCLLSMISSLAFWLNETFALRWMWMIIMRFLSGTLIPLIYLPSLAQQIMYYLPFEHLAYTPIRTLQNQITPQQSLGPFLILLGWSGIVFWLRGQIWTIGQNKYEGTGI